MHVDREGKWAALICRAASVTILGDAATPRFVPIDPLHQISALQSGAVDLLTANSPLTLARDAGQGVDFTAIYYYDGQGFMVPSKRDIRHVRELNRATICLQRGTTIESSLADHFRANNLGSGHWQSRAQKKSGLPISPAAATH
jgi:general L-amino acid transport system substrate-binding protein